MGPFIVFTDYAKLRDRCQITTVAVAHGHPAYENGAVVPADRWTPISPVEADFLRAPRHPPAAEAVELIAFPAPRTLDSVDSPWWTVHPPFTPAPGTQYANHATSPAGDLTVTVNPASGRRLGIHLDNWDRLPYAHRRLSRRRLCFNAGPGSRYLLVGDTDAPTICQRLSRDGPAHYPHTDDIRAYVHAGHPLRCLRLRLDPGEGYLAPTELLPHDGSTMDLPEPSTAAFWLGRWPIRAFPSLI
ncbi:hypothetical protein [Kitasatospora brasiliensis]|uniref:hypothetical protein n=1 Tax=Kitasatospora brasiliensis TaxID=3058040 RepID=UPI00293094DC|nr:hypothetical protein [Kitasatospora sp. K002]